MIPRPQTLHPSQPNPGTPQFASKLIKATQTLSHRNPGPGGHGHQNIQAKSFGQGGGRGPLLFRTLHYRFCFTGISDARKLGNLCLRVDGFDFARMLEAEMLLGTWMKHACDEDPRALGSHKIHSVKTKATSSNL